MATLELRDNNLYANGKVIVFENEEAELVREPIAFESKGNDVFHTVKKHDTIIKIGFKYYEEVKEDSGKYYFLICDANQIENPLDLSEYVGKDIIVPNLLDYLLTLD